MAKRSKYSTALFEVITNARKPEKPLGRPRGVMALATPAWWFKGGGKSAPPAADAAPEPPPAQYDPNDPTARVTAAALAARAAIRTFVPTPAVAPAEPWAATAAATATASATATVSDDEEAEIAARAFTAAVKPPEETRAPEADAAPDVSRSPDLAQGEAAPSRSPVSELKPMLSRPGLKVALNPERQEVMLRLRYTSAIVGGFALLVAVGLAYVFGRRMAEGPAPARAAAVNPSSADLRRGPAKPNVLDVRGARKAAAQVPARGTGATAPPPAVSRPPAPPVMPPLPPAAQEPAAYFEAALANGAARRQSNLNYAAIVSFPPEMKDRAVAARDFLNRNGVPCTVESVPQVTGDRKWHVVVGTRGFAARYSRLPEYSQYIDHIKGIGERFAGRFTHDRFKPTMFKWTEGGE